MTIDTHLSSNLLANKVAIITGASKGIGKATALLFAKAGAAVVLAARTAVEIQEVAEEIKANGGKALAIPTDVTQADGVDNLIILTLRAFRSIDILVNNAGVILPIGKVWEVNPAQWERLLKVNLIGPYLCSRAVLPQMLERGDGRIINISSGAADRDIQGWSAYCSSKAGLNRFSSVLAQEVAHTNIVVSSINPGTTETAMQSEVRQANFPEVETFKQRYEQKQSALPEEVAQLILWLASSHGSEQNGSILNLAQQDVREQIAQDLGLPLISNRHP